MAMVSSALGQLVHDAAAALIDNKIPEKLSDSVTGFVSAGFGIMSDVLVIVRDLAKPEAAPDKPPQS